MSQVNLREELKAAQTHIKELEYRLANLQKAFGHAIGCVDRVFQQDNTQPLPILPDFLKLGEDKFEGVVKLALAYKELEKEVYELKQEIEDANHRTDLE